MVNNNRVESEDPIWMFEQQPNTIPNVSINNLKIEPDRYYGKDNKNYFFKCIQLYRNSVIEIRDRKDDDRSLTMTLVTIYEDDPFLGIQNLKINYADKRLRPDIKEADKRVMLIYIFQIQIMIII